MTLEYIIYEGGIAPTKARNTDACWDLYLPSRTIVHMVPSVMSLNIGFVIPEGHCIEMYPRSSLLAKHGIMSPTSIIDYGYTASVHAIMYSVYGLANLEKGTRTHQVRLIKLEDYDLKSAVPVTDSRGGLGSSGL